MKQRWWIILVIFIIIFLVASGNNNREVAIVSYDYVNFRTTPDASNDDNILCQIVKGELVEIISSDGDWYKVSYWGQEGYLIKKSVEKSEDRSVQKPKDYEMKGIVVYEYVNFRSDTSMEGKENILGRINKDQEVDVVAFKNGWMEVMHGGTKGNVIGKSLRVHLVRKENESTSGTTGVIVYSYVNFRSQPNMNSSIICEIQYGTKVEVLSVDGDWVKIRYNGKIGYVVAESISIEMVVIDISDYNKDIIKDLKKFTKNAQEKLNFAGYYVQVMRNNHVNPYWKEIVQILDEMNVHYGLYNYTKATSEEAAQEQYIKFQQIIAGTRMKYNRFPFMIDLEGVGNQSEVVKFYNKELRDNYIVYANASDMMSYGYYKKAPQFWVAHYGLVETLPTKAYTEYPKAKAQLSGYSIWQFTSSGNKTLLGTNHLDMNIVSMDWWEKYK